MNPGFICRLSTVKCDCRRLSVFPKRLHLARESLRRVWLLKRSTARSSISASASENLQITGLRSGTFDVCIGHLSRTYDQIENVLLTREPVVLALPKGHRAARKKFVGLRDLKGELLIMPSKDLLPSIHQMIATAFLKNHIPLDRYQMAEHFQTGINLTKASVGYMFLPSSAKDFVPDGVVLRTPGFSIGPLDTFVLWSRGNVDQLFHRVRTLLKEIKREL